MTGKRKLVLVAVALLVATTVGVVVVARPHASERAALSRLSNEGHRVSVQRADVWRRYGVRDVSLLAVRGARALYLLQSRRGPCVGGGQSDKPGDLGSVECPHGPFPTSQLPVLDLSVYEGTTRGSRDLTLYRIEGVAADGVAAIAFLRPNGSVAVRVPVTANVYAASTMPGGPISGIVAYDGSGKELWHSQG
jgi:hypothetical protein